jgi:murein DD-endopeptidase MepM/ murein hydrolase activator NlpD
MKIFQRTPSLLHFFMVRLLILLSLPTACARGERTAAAPATDIVLPRESQTIEARVPRNATIETLFRQFNLPPDLTIAAIDAVRAVFNPRDLQADRAYELTRSMDGLFREFRYVIDTDRLLRVVRVAGGPPGVNAEIVALPKEIEVVAVAAEIGRAHPSLVGAFEAAGENVLLALQLAEIFGGEVDFNSDLQPGDRLAVLFERQVRDGEFLAYGDIKAAVLENDGRKLTAFRYPGGDGKPAWFDEQGRSLKRQFLQSPLPFEPRVTSQFSYRRLHPVHGTTRAHLGVDYGAPTGTRVQAVAAGVVEAAGWSGEAGRMIRLRHAGGYETVYLHLSAIAPGIRPGARVSQGDLIGRVGSTGTATGPHLDYRIIRNGTYVNPLTELKRMPKGVPLAPDALAVFQETRAALAAELERRIAAAPAPKSVAPPGASGK